MLPATFLVLETRDLDIKLQQIVTNVGDENVEMRCVATGDPLPELVFKKETAEAAFVNGINEDGRIEIRQEIDDQGRVVGM